MQFDLDARRARLSVGEFADFCLGPRESGEGPAGLWRAQLGTHWHQQLRQQAAADEPATQFEVAIEGAIALGGWIIALNGRIDQLWRTDSSLTVREIKTVTRPLPEDEALLRADYPGYFVQLAAYLALLRAQRSAPGAEPAPPAPPSCRAELVFVETASGLSQTVGLRPEDEGLLRGQLERVAEFLDLRWRARERLRALRFRPAFAALRPGQETVGAELAAAAAAGRTAILLEAPTGFGKTGVLLEFALGRLRAGDFERVLYLTSKATGQLQVVQTVGSMAPAQGGGGLAVWAVRPKAEHCVNAEFHCVRESCAYLDGIEGRWPASGLSRFYLFEHHPRDLATLREAGRAARICPYEITRAALPGNDLWIGDYNYVFAPGSRGLFYRQPGFEPGRSLLIIDEAHNLPSRVADAYSHALRAEDARAVAERFRELRPGRELAAAWEGWTELLEQLQPAPALSEDAVAEARRLVGELGEAIRLTPLDYGALGPQETQTVWELPSLADELEAEALPRLWWCRRPGELALTCLDAAPAIGAALREFGGVVLASATPGPAEAFAASCGLEAPLTSILAATPWRDHAYDVAYDLRVDTTFQHRARHYRETAATIAALRRHAAGSSVAVFFPSYAYAEAVRAAAEDEPGTRAVLQPRSADLAAQAAWVEEALGRRDALLLVLGSSFAESIDLLGGRVTHAMVVGPALPEVNPVQRARLAACAELGREAGFRRVYQIPGMQKVNQALGRLVRAPGQRAKVLLHCRRFAEPGYLELLAADYRRGIRIESDTGLELWLQE
jgi:Rad3-related DNA helicase